MKSSSLLCIVLGTSAVFSPAIARASRTGCDSIISHGLRNIEVSKSSEASIATKYFNHCQKEFDSMNDDTLASVEVEIFGVGEGSGKYSRQQRKERLRDWCITNKDISFANRTAFNESQVFYQGALTAWEKCNALYSKDIRITPTITPDAKTVSIGVVYTGHTPTGIMLYGVKTEGFSCEVAGPTGKIIRLPLEIRNLNIQVSCKRSLAAKQSRNGQEYQVLPRGTITVETASDPFQLFFAEEWDPGLPAKEAAQMRALLKHAELPVGTIVMSALSPDQFVNPKNPQHNTGKWVLAEGQPLPPGTLYEQITGSKNAPDLRDERQSLGVLDVVVSAESHGKSVTSAVSDAGKKGDWKWFLSAREVQGRRANGDFEQDENQFQVYLDKTNVIARGRTHNFKHDIWGEWRPGVANVLGISTFKRSNYYYIKVN